MNSYYTENVNFFITLCNIIEDFPTLEKKLTPLILKKDTTKFAADLNNISHNKFLISKEVKNFYQENKQIIDKINQSYNIFSFIIRVYNYNGQIREQFLSMYDYINKNKDKTNIMLNVLHKIKDLQIDTVSFYENKDFTKDIYYITPKFEQNDDINYVNNIKIIPNYTSDIKYITTGSNYKINAKLILNHFDFCKISLNSLIFDASTLPKKMNKETIFDSIVKLNEEQQPKTEAIRNSVNLGISIDDLDKQYNYTFNMLNRLNNVDNKEKLLTTLQTIKENINKLKKISAQYDTTISKEEGLSSEILKEEKQKYLSRRLMQEIDLD